VYFSGKQGVPDLARQLERLIDRPDEVEAYRERARERAEQYSWDAVATAYEELLLDVGGGTGHGPLLLDRVEEIERATGAALTG
jgi:hypothetical protein